MLLRAPTFGCSESFPRVMLDIWALSRFAKPASLRRRCVQELKGHEGAVTCVDAASWRAAAHSGEVAHEQRSSSCCPR